MKRQFAQGVLSSFRTTKRRQKPVGDQETTPTESGTKFYDHDDNDEQMDWEECQDGIWPRPPWEMAKRQASHQLQQQHRQFSLDSGTRKEKSPPSSRADNSNGGSSPHHHQQTHQLIRAKSTASPPPPCGCSPTAGPMEKSVGGESPAKVNFVLDELLSTERNYVRELAEMLCQYVQPFEALELNGSSLPPASLRSQSDILFGNLHDLHEFHASLLLPALQQNADSIEGISAVLCAQRQRLLALYRTYCRNKPLSEALRSEHGVDQNKFFMDCQRRAGHLLPLSAYLLKPIQRITKYQLLLKELLRHCPDAGQSFSVQTALASMLDLLAQINADMEQLHILGYPGDLRLLGSLRLQTECQVFVYKQQRANKSASVGPNGGGINISARRGGPKGKQQKRHLFLFDGGVLFCKKRAQTGQFASEYYEHKLCIPTHALGFAECSRHSAEDRFELWDVNETSCYAIQPLDERARPKWVQRLARMTVLQQQKLADAAAQGMTDSQQLLLLSNQGMMPSQYPANGGKVRPQSWTTTSSSEDGIGISSSSVHSSSVHSSRSSTSSANTFEDKCNSTELSQSALDPLASFGHFAELPAGHDQQLEMNGNNVKEESEQPSGRSQSQPPESPAIGGERQKKATKRMDRL